jgi:rRNA maturation protein Rpf1
MTTDENQKPAKPRGSANYEYLIFIIEKKKIPDHIIVKEMKRYNPKLMVEESKKMREVLKKYRLKISKEFFPQDWHN